jgi:NAD(P)-dependent dehydrogenase (short-subunit alcohol dehydrogenase family)
MYCSSARGDIIGIGKQMTYHSAVILSLAFAVGTAAAWTALPLAPSSAPSASVSALAAKKQQQHIFDRDDEPSSIGRRDFFQSTAANAAALSLLVASSSSSFPPAIANAADSNIITANPYSKLYQPTPHSMDGKIVLITGGNAGLGLESTKRLAAAGATVVFTSRDAAKGQKAVDEINNYLMKQTQVTDDATFAGKVLTTNLDLCDLENVKSFKERFVTVLGGSLNRDDIKIDVLMNNAGVMAIPDKRLTKDGYEQTFQSNHLGHFALTSTLMPLLATDGRIINVSSLAYLIASKNGLELDNLNGEKEYGPWSSYGESKLENILFTNELQRRLQNSEKYSNKRIMAFSLHPGAVQTDLARYIIGEEKFQSMKENGFASWQEKFLMEGLAKFIKTVQEGASTQIYLAASPNIRTNEAGLFFNDGEVMPLQGFATDKTKAEALWTVSEKLSGVKFDL